MKKTIIGLFLLVATTTGILVLGPFLSKRINKKYRKKIDTNPKAINAVIKEKNSHRGNTVSFRYKYRYCTNTETNK
jgi:hypothetical protein